MKLKALLLVHLLFGFAYAQEPMLRHFTVTDGLPSNVVYAIFQDSKSFLWVCTDRGVSRFDGHRFQNYGINQGLPDNEIFGINEDKWGRCWLVCYNHKAAYIQGNKVYTSTTDSVCRSIEKAGINYHYLFINKDGLPCLAGDRVCVLYKDSIAPRYQPLNGAGTALYYAALNGAEYLISGAVLLSVSGQLSVRTVLSETYMYSAVGFGDSVYVIGGYKNVDSIYCYTLKNNSALKNYGERFPSHCYQLEYLDNATIRCLTAQGIFDYQLRTRQFEPTVGFPAHIPFSRILHDNEGNTWLSTLNDGLYMQHRAKPKFYSIQSGLTDNNVICTNLQEQGDVVACYSRGGFSIINGKKVRSISLPFSGSLNRTKFAYQLSDGGFLVGSDRGLFRILKNNHRVTLSHEAQKACFRNGDTYYIGHSGGALRYDSRSGKVHTIWNERTTAIATQDGLHLWLGTVHGLYSCSNGAIQKFNVDSVLSDNRITWLEYLNDGQLVIATHRSGLYLWDGRRLRHINRAAGLRSNNCNKVAVSKSNDLWVCTDQGLDRISFDAGMAASIYHFSAFDGLPSSIVNDVTLNGQQVYIATTEGVVIVNEAAQTALSAPPVYMLSVTTRDSTIELPQKHLSLPYTRNDLHISYTGVALAGGNELQYRYVLEGLRSDTVYTDLTALNLSAMRPGDYKLLLWAKLPQGANWSSVPALLSFTINSPFWLTAWFRMLAISLLGLIGYSLYVRKVASVRSIEIEKSERHRQIASLEMQALRAQINPHFMFNVLNAIQHFYSCHNEREGNRYMGLFAQLIRKTLHHSKTHWMRLSEELEMLETYIGLEQMRFNYMFSYEFCVDRALNATTIMLPAMLLQPYVENAINHGFAHLQERKGQLTIMFRLMDQTLICSITDNGIGVKEALKRRAVNHVSAGLNINRQRMETVNEIYQTSITIEITDRSVSGGNEQGTQVTITIPNINIWTSSRH